METIKKEGIIDAWVLQYDDMLNHLVSIGMPGDKVKDYDWVKSNIKNYCDSATTFEILRNLKTLHGY